MRSVTARLAGPVLGLVLATLALGPVLVMRGWTLVVDMVFVPAPRLWPGLIGLDGRLPRAVPSDAVVALLSVLLPGQLVQRLLLVAVWVLGAAGGLRLVRLLLPPAMPAAGLAAAALVVWNPLVAERLALGQWAVLLGVAALPWVVTGTVRFVLDVAGGGTEMVLALALAAFTPTGGVVAAGVGMVVAAAVCPRRHRRSSGWSRRARRSRAVVDALHRAPVVSVLITAAVLNAPWWVPAVLRPGGLAGDPVGLTAFAARPDTLWGLPFSVLTLGGVWDPGAVPVGRGTVAGLVGPALLLSLSVGGWALLRRSPARGPQAVRVLTGLAVASAVVVAWALAAAWPPSRGFLEAATRAVPSLQLLRDGSRQLGPLVLLEALGVALCVDALLRRLTTRAVPVVGVVAVLVPMLALPGLTWGLLGRLQPVGYPSDWLRVRAALADVPTGVPMVVLPWGAYRRPAWNHDQVVLDPAVKFFGRPVVVDDSLLVAAGRLPGEDPLAARLDPLLRSPVRPVAGPLAAAGIGYVLVETDAAGAPDAQPLTGLQPVLTGHHLALYRVPDPAGPPTSDVPTAPVLAADVAAAGTVLGAVAIAVMGATSRRRKDRLPTIPAGP